MSFDLNSTAADGNYNVSVEMYDNVSNYNIPYQNESVVKGVFDATISQPANQITDPNVNATYELKITNTGNITDTFSLAVIRIDSVDVAALNKTTLTNLAAGETIYVCNGSYTENVNIGTASLTLEGEGTNVVTVTVADSNDHVFEVTGDCVNITGFTLENATGNGKTGIYLGDGVNSCNITNNTVKLNYNGIYLKNASGNNITCNWVNGNTRAGFNLTGGSIGNKISCNNIVANGVYNSGGWEWQFYNNQTQEVEAKNNYWGAGMTNETIEASIKENTGNVTFYPFAEESVPCAPIPELSTVILLGMGLLLLAGYLRIRRKM